MKPDEIKKAKDLVAKLRKGEVESKNLTPVEKKSLEVYHEFRMSQPWVRPRIGKTLPTSEFTASLGSIVMPTSYVLRLKHEIKKFIRSRIATDIEFAKEIKADVLVYGAKEATERREAKATRDEDRATRKAEREAKKKVRDAEKAKRSAERAKRKEERKKELKAKLAALEATEKKV